MALVEHLQVLISAQDTLKRAIKVIDASGIQIALVMDQGGHLLGTVTDGDIRRGILRGVGLDQTVDQVMNPHPITAPIGLSQDEIWSLMTSYSIQQLPLLDELGRVVGLELLDNLLHGPEPKDNPVVILAGGQGTRLRPLTNETPKPLLKIGGEPVLELILRQLQAQGFHRLFLSVNYLGKQIEEHFGDGRHHGVSIEYLHEPEPLGTAGPLSLVPKSIELPCIAVNSDLLTKVSFEHLLKFHQESGFNLTIGVKEYAFQVPFGVVATHGDQVVGFQEKPVETRFINTGVYVLDRELLDMVPEGSYYDMNQLIEQAISHSKITVGAFLIHEYWKDIGTASDYQQAQQDYRVLFSS